MAGSEGEHGSKENSGGGCFSAQAWCACQILTEREKQGGKMSSLWRPEDLPP